MEIVLVVVVVMAIVFFLLKNRTPEQPQKEHVSQKKSTPEQKDFRVHTKMDVPMIRSRIEKLNFTDGLEAHAKKKLDKIILESCAQPEPMYWWEPLRKFSRLPNASKGSKFMFVNAMSIDGQRVIVFILNLSEMIRFCGLRLNTVEDNEGEKIPAYELEDGLYNVIAAIGAKNIPIKMTILNAQIDMNDFIQNLNQILHKYKATHRLVTFIPDGSVFCLLCTGYAESQLAERFQ